MTCLRQPTHQRLAEMPCTTRDEDVRTVQSSILERDQAAHAARGKQSAIVSEAAAARAATVRTWFQAVQLMR